MSVCLSHPLQQKYINKLVDEHLVTDKNFSSQSSSSIASVKALVRRILLFYKYSMLISYVYHKASEKFPKLRGYADCWPVTDSVRLKLKYTCGRSHAEARKLDAKAGKCMTRSLKKRRTVVESQDSE